MTLWETIAVVVYLAGAWVTFKGGMERMVEVKCQQTMGYAVHRIPMFFHRVFYRNTFQVIITALVWPVSMIFGILALCYYIWKQKRDVQKTVRHGPRK